MAHIAAQSYFPITQIPNTARAYPGMQGEKMKCSNLFFSIAMSVSMYCGTANAVAIAIDDNVLDQDSAMLKQYWADHNLELRQIKATSYDFNTRTARFVIEVYNGTPTYMCFNVTVLNDGSQAAPLDTATSQMPDCNDFTGIHSH
jgi:hypothetical protein